MTNDEYSEITNSEETYSDIAEFLKKNNSVFVGWTDGDMTHFDILFTYNPLGFGTHQGGVRPTDLFVSIMRIGAFGFEIEHEDTHASYYEEKLAVGLHGLGSTGEKLAELINGVKKYLNAE